MLSFANALAQVQAEKGVEPTAGTPLAVTFDLVSKADEQRRVFGWFSVSEVAGELVVDSHDDVIEPEEMEEAAYYFVLTSRVGGDNHETIGTGVLIESMMFTKEKQEALGIDLGRVGWWGGLYITDDEVWTKIKKGERPMFSWSGFAQREEIDDGEEA